MQYEHTENILSRLEKVRRVGRGKWVACCPAHGDTQPSMSITESNQRVLLYCHSQQCDGRDIVESIGLKLVDLYAPELRPQRKEGKFEAPKPVFDYSYEYSLKTLTQRSLVVEPWNVTREDVVRYAEARRRIAMLESGQAVYAVNHQPLSQRQAELAREEEIALRKRLLAEFEAKHPERPLKLGKTKGVSVPHEMRFLRAVKDLPTLSERQLKRAEIAIKRIENVQTGKVRDLGAIKSPKNVLELVRYHQALVARENELYH